LTFILFWDLDPKYICAIIRRPVLLSLVVVFVLWPRHDLLDSACSLISGHHCKMSCSFIHSFRLFLYRLFKFTTTQRPCRHSTDSVSKFHAEAPQATVSEGFYIILKV